MAVRLRRETACSRLAGWVALCVTLGGVACDAGGRRPPDPSGATTSSGSLPAPDPQADGDPRLDRALAFLSRGDSNAAAELAGVVLVEHPGSYRARFLVALSRHRSRLYEAAARDFESIRASGAQFAGSLSLDHFLGWALFHLGRVDEARAAWERHAKAQPGTADTSFGLGLVALDEDRLEEAERHLREAEALHASRPGKELSLARVRLRLADLAMRRGEWQSARGLLETVIAAAPTLSKAQFKLARVLAALGDADGAARARDAYERLSATPDALEEDTP